MNNQQRINECIKLMEKITGKKVILKENDEFNIDKIVKHVTDEFYHYVVPGSANFVYGPNDEGGYEIDFDMRFSNLDNNSIEDEEKSLKKSLGGNSYNGPGAAYSKLYVSYEGYNKGNYIFKVNYEFGYDI